MAAFNLNAGDMLYNNKKAQCNPTYVQFKRPPISFIP
jgi:hypothetical protein